MWRSIGAVNPNEPKHNRSRDQGNYEPFAQASRLKLNQSQLSGQAPPPQFLNQYFVKKRSPQGLLQRALSQKNIEIRPYVSPPSSMKEVSPRQHLKSEPNQTVSIQKSILPQELKQTEQKKEEKEEKQQKSEKQAKKIPEKQYKILKNKVTTIKGQHSNLKKTITGELDTFKQKMQEIQSEMSIQFQQWNTVQQQKQQKQGFNPELLTKLKSQSNKFSQRMRQIDAEKQKVRQRYRQKLLEL